MTIHNINPVVLKQCRQQIGLHDMDEAKRVTGVSSLDKIEAGEKQPTLKQQEKLADVYAVPFWAFYKSELPAEYDSDAYPEFRSLKGQGRYKHLGYKLSRVITLFNRYRRDLLDIADGSFNKFEAPEYTGNAKLLARSVKDWLGHSDQQYLQAGRAKDLLDYWKRLLEDKGILIFTTSAHNHWSKVDVGDMRGMAIYHDALPVIILNGSDAHKANLFTLMHELGHIIERKTVLNLAEDYQSKESFCNTFAAEMLMPDEYVSRLVGDIQGDEDAINRVIQEISRTCGVSAWAVAVMLKIKGKITEGEYKTLEEGFQQKVDELKARPGGPLRNRPKEIVNLYGRPYTRAILQLYHDEEITINKLFRALGVTNFSYLEGIEAIV